MTGWMVLAIAVVFEVLGATCMKLSNGLTRLWPTVWMMFFYILTFIGLAISIHKINLSIVYSVWAGMGIVLITMVDMFWFKTDLGPLKLFAIALIVVGAIMLKLLTD